MVHPIINDATENISETTTILTPEEIDLKLLENASYVNYKTYAFWRLLFDGIPLQVASTFKFMDLDLDNLALTHRKRTPGKPTKTVKTYLLSNCTGTFLNILVLMEKDRPSKKYIQRKHRRIFPSRRTIETWLQQLLKEVGVFNLPNRKIPNLDFPKLDRDMESWKKCIEGSSY